MAFTKARAGESSGAKLRDGLRDGGDEVVAGRQTWRAEAGSEKGEPGVRTCVARERNFRTRAPLRKHAVSHVNCLLPAHAFLQSW